MFQCIPGQAVCTSSYHCLPLAACQAERGAVFPMNALVHSEKRPQQLPECRLHATSVVYSMRYACPVLVLLRVAGSKISIQSSSTLANTFLWPTDQAWAEFFEDVLRSSSESSALEQLTVAKALAAAGVAPGNLFGLCSPSTPFRIASQRPT
jgi:hypothetical protein